MSRPYRRWPGERIATFRRLAAEGKGYRQISEAMGIGYDTAFVISVRYDVVVMDSRSAARIARGEAPLLKGSRRRQMRIAAMALWNEGNKSARAIARELGLGGADRVYDLLREARKLGLEPRRRYQISVAEPERQAA